MMIGYGAKARFCPCSLCGMYDSQEELRIKSVTGTVCYINWEHKYFTVEYDFGGTKQMESFKFFQIGKEVMLCGK